MPKTPDWIVEDALNQVIDAVKRGASPLVVENTTADGLKNRYRPDFEKQHKKGADWLQHRETVLDLARKVGEIAKALTRECYGPFPDQPPPGEVAPQPTYLAAYLVARTHSLLCNKRGPYCEEMFISTEGELQQKLDSLFSKAASS